jgi:pimeloyl-ACP methyl ester carboxylesterase
MRGDIHADGIATAHSVATASGRIGYVEAGSGPVALFIHGVLLNSHLWRHQIAGLADLRRCVAVDLLAHGDTDIDPNQDVSVTANAKMLTQLIDALDIDQVDVVGNDSGGGIAQIFAATNPERVRTLTLTNCDTHDNWPPEAFKPFMEMAASGGLTDTLNAMLRDKAVYRSPDGLGPAYEHPDAAVSDDDIDTYLRPFVRNAQRTHDLERFLAAFDNRHTTAIEPQLRQLHAPTLIAWATDDVFFSMKWAHWLADTIPGAKPPVEIPGGRIFFPEERPNIFNQLLREHWAA